MRLDLALMTEVVVVDLTGTREAAVDLAAGVVDLVEENVEDTKSPAPHLQDI